MTWASIRSRRRSRKRSATTSGRQHVPASAAQLCWSPASRGVRLEDDDDVEHRRRNADGEQATRIRWPARTEAAGRLGRAGGRRRRRTALAAAGEQFCRDAKGYVEALDRYGKLFTDEAATVGDVETLGADLVEPRETVAAAVDDVEAAKTALAEAGQELVDAQAALAAAIATASSVPTSSTTPATTTTTTIVPPATIERVAAGRGRSGPDRRGNHGRDAAVGGDGGVQLGCLRAADRMAQAALRCRLPHRRAAGRGASSR